MTVTIKRYWNDKKIPGYAIRRWANIHIDGHLVAALCRHWSERHGGTVFVCDWSHPPMTSREYQSLRDVVRIYRAGCITADTTGVQP